VHAAQKNLIPRIAAKSIETRVDSETDQPPGAVLIRQFQVSESLVSLLEAGVNNRDFVRRDVTSFLLRL
jgi:hypothetical protein